MKVDSILATIGDTPHIRLSRLFPDREVWVKCERANPGGSIKDRIGLAMIEAAASGPAARSSSRPRATPASGSPWSRRSRATGWCW
jgi:cysteine synthase